MIEDPNIIEFNTEKEFIEFVNNLDHLTSKEKQEKIEHEKAHHNKAVMLGYRPSYYCNLNKMFEEPYFFVELEKGRRKPKTKQDVINHLEIVNAPSKLSKGDLETKAYLEKLLSHLENLSLTERVKNSFLKYCPNFYLKI